jgi:XTP/dITP diphosphohydrolase
MKIIFASSNAGKIRELRSWLSEFNMEVVPQTELDIRDVPETGLTFVENALIKARHACEQSGYPAIADDSGLAVDALQGAPGIFSARYAGLNANSKDNIRKLLDVLKDVPDAQRTARFHCVLVYMTHAEDPVPLICHATWEGRILRAEQGDDDFGYNPIFYVPDENKSAAEIPLEIKNRISHRGQALRMLVTQILSSQAK